MALQIFMLCMYQALFLGMIIKTIFFFSPSLLQCLYMKAFPPCLHDLYEEEMQKMVRSNTVNQSYSKTFSEVEFFADVVKQEIVIRIFMDVKNISYFQSLRQLKGRIQAEHDALVNLGRKTKKL